MDSISAKDLSTLVQEIAWSFGARGFYGECCGDLSLPEYRTLCLASDQHRCSMQEIAKGLGFTKSGATRLIDRLEKKGFVKRIRSPEDGRVCCVEITLSGRVLIDAVNQKNENRIAMILSKIDPAMQKVLRVSLQSLVQAIKEEG